MTFKVFQHWDPLRVCVVGRSYPPEFYSWITIPHVRNLFERIAQETEEDFQKIIKKLEEFHVEIYRPELPESTFKNGRYLKPPMTPRDYMVMMGDKFYENYSSNFCKQNYDYIKDVSWPDCFSWDDFNMLPDRIQEECKTVHNFGSIQEYRHEYDKIISTVIGKNNVVKSGRFFWVNGAMVSRLGKDIFFGTENSNQDLTELKKHINSEFPQTRNHIVDTKGHSDATYCPVCPGLIISLYDVSTYKDTFPDWEVVYLPGQSWEKVTPFLNLKRKNSGKWWIPGFEYDQSVIDTVQTWLTHWTGLVEETVFDVNMLIIDPKNVMVFNENDSVFRALHRYGITPHVVPFRHRYFWDGGIHCVTLDLDRKGGIQDFFPERSVS